MLGTRCTAPSGGIGQSNASSPAVRARMSSFILNQAPSWARMSIESVFATAPSPRGCLRSVHPYFERVRLSVFDVSDEDRELAERRLYHVGPRRVARSEFRAPRPAQ